MHTEGDALKMIDALAEGRPRRHLDENQISLRNHVQKIDYDSAGMIADLYDEEAFSTPENQAVVVRETWRLVALRVDDGKDLPLKPGSAKVPAEQLTAFLQDVMAETLKMGLRGHASPQLRQRRFQMYAQIVEACVPTENHAEMRDLISRSKKALLLQPMPGDQKHRSLEIISELEQYLPKPAPAEALAYTATQARNTITSINTTAIARRAAGTSVGAALLLGAGTQVAAASPNDEKIVKTAEKTPHTSGEDIASPTSFEEMITSLGISVNTGSESQSQTKSESSVSSENTTETPQETDSQTSPIPSPTGTGVETPDPTPSSETLPSETPSASPSPETSATQNSTPESSANPVETTPTTTPETTTPPPDSPPAEMAPLPEPFQPADANETRNILSATKVLEDLIAGVGLNETPTDQTNNEPSTTPEMPETSGEELLTVPDLTDPEVIASQEDKKVPAEQGGILSAMPVLAGIAIEQESLAEQTIPTTEEVKQASDILAEAMGEILNSATEEKADAPKEEDKNVTQEADVEKIKDKAYRERVADLKNQSGTPLSVDRLYDLFTDADKKYNHPVIGRELLLSMAYRESLLGKLDKPSSAGARGMVQFMRGTWEEWGKGKDIMDDEANVDASFRYMIHLYKWVENRFPKASKEMKIKYTLVAYNWGLGNLDKKGKMPNNSAKIYANNIYKSTYKTLNHIQKALNNTEDHKSGEVAKSTKYPYQSMIDGAAKHFRLKDKHGDVTGKLKNSELEKIGKAWGGNKLIPEAAESFRLMNKAFKKKFGRNISIGNSYRTYERQIEMAGPMAATPGESRHGSGIAIDLGEANNDWGEVDREWLHNEGWKYGWVNPLWAQKGQRKYEPWHIEFLGSQAKKEQKRVVKWQLKGHKDGRPVSEKLKDELGIK